MYLRKALLVRVSSKTFGPSLHSGYRKFSSFSSYALGFESSPLLSIEADSSILEKSIRGGCRNIYTRSVVLKGEAGLDISKTVAPYELLADLHGMDEIDLQHFHIGHCLSIPNQDNWTMEIKHIDKLLRNKPLDFVNVNVSDVAHLCDDARRQELSLHLSSLRSLLHTFTNMKVTKVGIHFDTQSLFEASYNEMDLLIQNLSSIDIHSIAVATNAFTYNNASQIYSWIQDQEQQKAGNSHENLIVIACEANRAHHRRPALIGLPLNYTPIVLNRQQQQNSSGDEKEQAIEDTISSKTMKQHAEDLKLDLDRCIHMEKQYIAKLVHDVTEHYKEEKGEATVPVTDLCMGHVLLKTESSIQSIEEWQYLRQEQITPQLEKAMENVKRASLNCQEWVSLYRGIVRHLHSTFTKLLQSRKLFLSCDVLHSVLREICQKEVQGDNQIETDERNDLSRMTNRKYTHVEEVIHDLHVITPMLTHMTYVLSKKQAQGVYMSGSELRDIAQESDDWHRLFASLSEKDVHELMQKCVVPVLQEYK
jgi:hypothetical protein